MSAKPDNASVNLKETSTQSSIDYSNAWAAAAATLAEIPVDMPDSPKKNTNDILLNVPLSEAFDKYTVLQIKYLHNNKNKHIKNEMVYLANALRPYFEKVQKFVDVLYDINKIIYKFCDLTRDDAAAKLDPLVFSEYTRKIIKWNDARYRAKRKIDAILNSTFKEQKNYKLKICIMGARNKAWVRAFSFHYDLVFVQPTFVQQCPENSIVSIATIFDDARMYKSNKTEIVYIASCTEQDISQDIEDLKIYDF